MTANTPRRLLISAAALLVAASAASAQSQLKAVSPGVRSGQKALTTHRPATPKVSRATADWSLEYATTTPRHYEGVVRRGNVTVKYTVDIDLFRGGSGGGDLRPPMIDAGRAPKTLSPDVFMTGDPVDVADGIRSIAPGGNRPIDLLVMRARQDISQSDATIESLPPDPQSQPAAYTYYLDPFVAHGNAKPAPVSSATAAAALPIPERAALRLSAGHADEAVAMLRSYTEANPDDSVAARTLALALLDVRRTAEGIELMGKVYEQSPALGTTPIAADAVGSPQDLRELVTRAVAQAHKSNTSAAWMTAAVLMQAEGRREPALKMLDKADAAALNSDVSSVLRAALR